MSDDLSAVLSGPVRKSLSEEIASRLREAIVNGHLSPGERLREETLATSLGVSRGPVREALIKLEREGLVIVRPNRGAIVARLSRGDLDEVYSLRLALERLAIHEAIRNAADDDFAELHSIVDRIREAAATEITVQVAAELDVRFHRALVHIAGHKRLYRSWNELRPHIHLLLLSRNVQDADFRVYVVKSHQEILDAVQARDVPRAVSLLEDHLAGAYVRVVKSYKTE